MKMPSLELAAPEALEISPEFKAWDAAHKETYRVIWHVDILPLPEMPLFLYPMSVGVQETIGLHYQSEGRLRSWQDYCYFCYTLDGVGGFGDTRGEHLLPAGQGFLTEIADPATRYFYPGADARPWRFLALNFRGLAARAMVRDLVGLYGHVYALSPQSPIIQRLLHFEAFPYKTLHPHALDSAELVLELLLALGASARAATAPNPLLGLVRHALEIMDGTLEDGLSVSLLAVRLGVSREQVSRSFQKYLGRPPQQVIREMKMRRASFLLKDTDLPVAQIAERLGYSDQTNFIRAFRAVLGTTPHEFRRHGTVPLLRSFQFSHPPGTEDGLKTGAAVLPVLNEGPGTG